MTRTTNARVAAFLQGGFDWNLWMPMLVFEVTVALWLLIKGVAAPARRQLA